MSGKTFKWLVGFGALLATGCQSTPVSPQTVPALIDSNDVQSREEIGNAISISLGGVPVTLSATAFTQSSRLFIDQGVLRNRQSGVADGKILDAAPRRFELLSSKGRCFLVGPNPDKVTRLTGVRCRQEPAR